GRGTSGACCTASLRLPGWIGGRLTPFGGQREIVGTTAPLHRGGAERERRRGTPDPTRSADSPGQPTLARNRALSGDTTRLVSRSLRGTRCGKEGKESSLLAPFARMTQRPSE